MSDTNLTNRAIGGALVIGAAGAACLDMGITACVISLACGGTGYLVHDSIMGGEISAEEMNKSAAAMKDRGRLKVASVMCGAACVVSPLVGIPATLGALAIHINMDVKRQAELDDLYKKLCEEYKLPELDAQQTTATSLAAAIIRTPGINADDELEGVPTGTPEVPNLTQQPQGA